MLIVFKHETVGIDFSNSIRLEMNVIKMFFDSSISSNSFSFFNIISDTLYNASVHELFV